MRPIRGLEEIELSRIAAPKASNPDIHSLALRILDERGRADEALAQLAVSRGIDLPAALEPGRQAEVDRFSTLPANEIERAYLAALLRIHDPDVADSRNQSKMGQDVELHAWVYDNLPLLEDQQEEIHRLARIGRPREPVALALTRSSRRRRIESPSRPTASRIGRRSGRRSRAARPRCWRGRCRGGN